MVMIKRLSGLAVVAVFVAACGPSAIDTSTTNPETAPAPAVLGYALSAGNSLSYQVDMDQHIEFAASGDQVGDEEDLPGEASVDITGSATFTHEVSAGPDPDTYEVHITGEFTDVTVTGTVDGEDVSGDMADIPDFAPMDPIDVTFVVDDQGNLVTDGSEMGDPFASMFGDISELGSGIGGTQPGQFVGPAFPDEEVTVGDTWSETTETPLFGDEKVTTTVESTVTGTDEVDGNQVLVIETNTAVSPFALDLGEFLAGFLGGFAGEGEDGAEIEEMLDQIVFEIQVDGAGGDSIAFFDPDAGITRSFDTTSAATIGLEMNVPDETTGEMMGGTVDMTLDQHLTYTLLDSAGD